MNGLSFDIISSIYGSDSVFYYPRSLASQSRTAPFICLKLLLLPAMDESQGYEYDKIKQFFADEYRWVGNKKGQRNTYEYTGHGKEEGTRVSRNRIESVMKKVGCNVEFNGRGKTMQSLSVHYLDGKEYYRKGDMFMAIPNETVMQMVNMFREPKDLEWMDSMDIIGLMEARESADEEASNNYYLL